MNKDQLLELKEEIDNAKSETSKLEGKLEHLKGQLKKEWKCNSVKEAEEKLEEMKQESDKIQEKIDKGVRELEEKYELS